MSMKNYKELLKSINISFKDKSLYLQALTHPSYENEVESKYGNYQRLEFVGDAVLEIVVTRYIYFNYPSMQEGSMTLLRSNLVREESLYELAKYINLGDYILLGVGELQAKGNTRPSLVSDVFEALIAAIYFDLGLEEAEKFVMGLIKRFLDDVGVDNVLNKLKDYKTRLQEYYQVERKSLRYELIKQEGTSNKPIFTFNVYTEDNVLLGTGKGSSKQNAQQAAAKDALEKMAK